MKGFLILLLLGALACADDGVDEELKELEKHAEALQETVKRTTERLPVDSEEVARFQKKALDLANDKRFTKAAEELWANSRRNELLIAEAVFFVLVLVLKAWRQAKAKHWFRKLLSGFFWNLVLWAGVVFVLPALILGEPYRIFVGKLWSTFVQGN